MRRPLHPAWASPLSHSSRSCGGIPLDHGSPADSDDTTGEVSGTRVTGRPSSPDRGLLLYIMVDSVAATVDVVPAHGGEIVQPLGEDAPELTARFRDPGGNVIDLYQEPSST